MSIWSHATRLNCLCLLQSVQICVVKNEEIYFAGFVMTDMNYCICYLDQGQEIPSSILEREDYNPYHTKLDTITSTEEEESLGPITKSDQQQNGSMLYLCYSYNTKDDATSDDEFTTTNLSMGLRGSASSVE